MNSMFCAEQIVVPPELGAILKNLTKAVIREEPKEVYKFAANYFSKLTNQPPPFDSSSGQYLLANRPTTSGQSANSAGSGSQRQTGMGAAIANPEQFESVGGDGASREAEIARIFSQYDSNQNGRLEANEIPALINDLRNLYGAEFPADTDIEAFVANLDVDQDGTIDLGEFRRLFFQGDDL